MRSLLGRFRRPISRSQLEKIGTMVLDGDGSTLSLDFTAMSSLDSRFTFSRSSTATLINSSGLVTTASTNVPRFDYDPSTLTPRGLLIEGSATNLCRSSNDLRDSTYWTLQTSYSSTSNTAGPSPDGTNNATSFTEPSSTAQRSIYQSQTAASGTYTGSIWAKSSSGSTRYIRLVVSSGASDFGYVTVNINTGTIQQAAARVGTATNASATATQYPSGWVRITLTVTLAASVNFMFAVPTDLSSIDTPTANYGRVSYLGDGSVFMLWGAQLEAGSASTSYIPTGASTVQRAADSCSIALSSFGFSTTGGTFYVDFFRRNISGATGSAIATDYASPRWFGIDTAAASNTVNLNSWGGMTSSANGSTRNKVGASYGAWGGTTAPVSLCVNNTTVVTGNRDFNPSTATYLTIGAASAGSGSSPPYGVASRDWLYNSVVAIKYWPTRLSDAALQSLTA